MSKLTHVNIIKRRDTWNFSASTASSENCQYVMVCWSVYDCVAAYTCENNSIQKHLYLFSIEPIKRYVTISGGLHLCISVCGCGYLSTDHNEETIRTVVHLSHQVMSVNMWYSDYLSFSVWIHIPLDSMQRRNNHNCSAFQFLRKLPSLCGGLSLSVLVCGCRSL